MSYEKTIARQHRIYNITIGTGAATVYSLLSASDKSDYASLVVSGRVQRIVVDGYIVSTGAFQVATSAAGAFEDVASGEKYTVPVEDWLKKTWVKAAGNITAKVRIFFS